jgi:hypothetical protein
LSKELIGFPFEEDTAPKFSNKKNKKSCDTEKKNPKDSKDPFIKDAVLRKLESGDFSIFEELN